MGFLYPAFLLGALAIAVPIVLHLLRRDVAPEVPFSAVRLLHRSPITRTRRRRLRDLLLLAARIAALALLALAFARPYLAASQPAGLLIVAVDRSYSMGAPGRFARAQAIAGEAIAAAPLGDRVAVIAFDDRADVVAAPGSAADARTALKTLAPGFRTTRYARVVERAKELAGNAPVHLVVVTDLQRSGWDDEPRAMVPANIRIETRTAGAAAPNAAVTGVRVEADRVIATVANRSGVAFASTARATVDGKVIASAPLRVPANGTADAVMPYRAGGRGSVAVSIDDPAGFPADDVRYAALGAPGRVRVALLTAGGSGQSGLYVSRALQAAGERFAVDLAPGPAVFEPGGSAAPAALILLSTRGVDRALREDVAAYVRAGGGALLAAGPDMEPSVIAALFGWPEPRAVSDDARLTFAASDVRHPIFRPFGAFAADLGQVRFRRIWNVDERGWDTAARFADGSPALLERVEGQGRVLLFASDLDRRWNEFPLHAAFVPFVAEAVMYAANAGQSGRDYLVAEAPPGAKPEPGAYVVNGRVVAVNVDTREGSPDLMAAAEFEGMLELTPAAVAAGPASGPRQAQLLEAERSLWQYGLVLMLAALVLESIVGRA